MVRRALSFLLLATLAVMDTFLSGYKRNDTDNEAGSTKVNEASSSKEAKCRKHNRKYVSFGFINGEQRLKCLLCMKMLAANSMRLNKLKIYINTAYRICWKNNCIIILQKLINLMGKNKHLQK
jgi:hypothetical protein